MKIIRRRPGIHLSLLAAGLVSVLGLEAHANYATWTGNNNGSWSNPGNWDISAVPTSLTTVSVDNGTTILLSGTSGGAYDLAGFGTYAGASGNFQLIGGLFTGANAVFGYAAKASGSATVYGGTWNYTQGLGIGYSGTGNLTIAGGLLKGDTGALGTFAKSTGIASISSGTWDNSGGGITVGDAGSGTFTISGGKVSTDSIGVAVQKGSTGSVTITGGTLDFRYLDLGDQGAGAFSFLGGTASVDSMNIGSDGGSGTLTLAGGRLVSGSHVDLNKGKIIVSSGTWVADGELNVNNNSSIALSGGLISGTQTNAIRVGTALVTGGTWSGSSLIVGYIGAGALNISGGLVSASDSTLLASASARDSGAIALSGSGVLATSRIVEGDGKGSITFNGGTIRALANEADFVSAFEAGDVRINAGGASIDTNGFSIGLQTPLSGAGALHKLGAGLLTLSGANSFSGGVVVEAGGLKLGSTSALGPSSQSLSLNNNGTLDLAGFNLTLGNLTGSGSSAISNTVTTAVTLTLNQSGTSTYAGTLADGASPLSLIHLGKGALTLSGSNSYTGGTRLSGGTLNLGNAFALGTGTLTIQAAATLDNTSGAALTLATNNAQAWNADLTFKGTQSLDLGTSSVLLNGTRTVTVASSTLTVGGAISGVKITDGLTKSGTGTLVLAADNLYTGPTTISAGTLQLGVGGTTGSLGAGKFVDNGTLAINRGDNLTYGALISGVGKFLQAGSGTLTLSGTNTYSGGTTINNGAVVLGNARALGNGGDLTVNSGLLDLHSFTVTVSLLSGTGGIITNQGPTSARLISNTIRSGTFAGFLQDGANPVSFEKAGTGALTLSGSNAYTGGTTLSGGTLNLANASALGSGPLTISGVTTFDNTSGSALQLASPITQNWLANFTFRGSSDLDLGTGGVFLGSATRTITVSANSLIVGGPIFGANPAVGLIKAGAGAVILNGPNTYAGATTISAGTLQLGNGGTTGSLGLGAIADGGTFAVNRSDDLTLANVISGKGFFVKAGAGALTLNGANSYTGGTTLNDGALILGNVRAIGNGGDLTVNSGLLDLHGFSPTVALLSGTGGSIVNTTGTSTLTTNTTRSGTFAGTLADQGGTLALFKAGSGTLTLSGSNSFSGGATLSAGGLNLANASALGSGTFAITGVSTFDNNSGGTLTLRDHDESWLANFTFRGSADLNLGGGVTLLAGSRTVTVASHTLTVGQMLYDTTAPASLTKSGTGTLVLLANNSYRGTTTISAGILQLGNGDVAGSTGAGAIFNSGTLIVNRADDFTLANNISGVGRFIKNGFGAVTLSGTNPYTGGTTINEGTVFLGNSRALGNGGDLTVNGGTLNLQRNSLSVGLLSGSDGLITVNGGFLSYSIGIGDNGVFSLVPSEVVKLTTNSNKSSTFAGRLSDEIVSSGGGGVFTGSGTITGGGIYTGTSGPRNAPRLTITSGGPIYMPELLALEKAGTGTLTLSGSNTYSGGTTLIAGGLNLANDHALGSGPLTISGVTTLDNTSGTALSLANNISQNWNANFTFRGSSDLDLGSGTVALNATRTITVASHTLTIGGEISGPTASTGLTKSGTGTLLLTGASTYLGATTINAGTLQLGNGGPGGSVGPGAIANFGLLVLNRSDDFTLANVISGNGRLVQSGSGTVTLTGASSYTGGTTINNGAVILGNNRALGNGGDLTVNSSLLDLHGFSPTVGLLTGAGSAIINTTGTSTLTTNTTRSGTFAGTLADQGGVLALVKAGTGVLNLTGSNSYSGGTTLTGGGLNLGNASALGSGPLVIDGPVTLDNTSGSALTLANDPTQSWNANFTFKGTHDLDLSLGAVTLHATHTVTVTVTSGTLTVGGPVSGATAATGLIKAGAGALILGGDNTYLGATTISAGTLQVGRGGSSGSLASSSIADNGILAFNRSTTFTYSGPISGRGSVEQNGSGTLTLTGRNTYTGGTTLNSGELRVGSARALGTGSLTLHSGLLATDGTQHQINLSGDLIWNSSARISLSLTSSPATTESVNIGGSLKDDPTALEDGLLTFVFDNPAGPGTYLVMTAAKGFGTIDASRFTYQTNDSDLNGSYFVIDGKNLYFIDPNSGSGGVSLSSFGASGSTLGLSFAGGATDTAFTTATTDTLVYSFTWDVGALATNPDAPAWALNSPLSLTGPTAVPEPSTWVLFIAGALAVLALRRQVGIR